MGAYIIAKFFRGSSDENEKLAGKFLRASSGAQKNRQIFEKKDPKNVSPAAAVAFFSKTSSVDLMKVLGQSWGVQKTYLAPPPPLTGCDTPGILLKLF